MSTAPIPVEQFGNWINALAASIQTFDAAPVWKEWLVDFQQAIAEGFEQSRSPSGEAFAPLKRRRSKGHNPDPHPLMDSLELMRSVTGQGSGTILEITRDSIRYGTSLAKAGWQKYGTSNIPARDFFGLNDTLVLNAVNRLRNAILTNLGS